jgi:WD40 repeat protein
MGMNRCIQQAEAVLPVTAVAIIDLRSRILLVAGQGSRLKIFDKDSGVLLASEQVFQAQVIHGIQCRHIPHKSQTRCLIWGGRSIAIYKVIPAEQGRGTGDVQLAHIVRELSCSDWIADATLLLHSIRGADEAGSLPQAIFLTSHNVLHSLSIDFNVEQTPSVSASVTLIATGPSSILYSAHLLVHDTGQVFVAAGTVFGEVLFWRYELQHDCAHPGTSTEGELIYSFLGHEGSVFGVRILEVPVESYSLWVIASCSDDRTIRVWDISDTLRENAEPKCTFDTLEKADIGFRSPALLRPGSSTGCLATIIGHSSRIWDVRFVPSPEAICRLISSGEDATCQTWLMTKNHLVQDPNAHLLRLQGSYNNHIGKNVWGIAVSGKVDEASVILTGGADGRIISYSIPDTYTTPSNLNAQQWTAEPSSIRSANSPSQPFGVDVLGTRLSSRASPAKAYFATMQGYWNMHRVLRSVIPTYPSGIFNGTAIVTLRDPTDAEYDAEYLYTEEGEFTTEQGLCIKGSRSYVYRFQDATDSITAWFVKKDNLGEVDYLFHRVEFDKTLLPTTAEGAAQSRSLVTASGHHLCIDDTYNAEYRFQYNSARLKSWAVKYEVKGPKKDYTADTTYTERFETTNHDDDVSHGDKLDRAFKDRNPITRGGDSFKTYCWTGLNELICCTARGLILRGVLEASTGAKDRSAIEVHEAIPTRQVSWDLVDTVPDLVSYSITASACEHTILFGAASGTVYRYRRSTNTIDSVRSLPRKLAGLFAQQIVQSHQGDARYVTTVASCLGDSFAYSFRFREDDEDNQSASETISLHLPPNFVVTSGCFTRLEDLLVLGSRNGALAFYDRSTFSVNASMMACCYVRHVHAEDAVTVIKEVPRTEAKFPGLFLLTAGRDSKFAMHRVRVRRAKAAVDIELETIHTSEPPFGPNVEGATFDSITNDLLLWGFRSTDFVVWNALKQKETMKVACGGSHRSWTYSPSNDGLDGGKFVWTKASTCNVQIQRQASHRVLQPGGHGREIKAMAISSLRQVIGGCTGYLIATGAEDTTVRISLHAGVESDSSEPSKCLGVISKHNTGLQQLCWSPDGRYLFSAGGREEFYIWKIQPVPCLGIGFTCQLQGPAITDSLELRIMDFDVAVVHGENEPSLTSSYLLSILYSDSTVRVSRQRSSIVELRLTTVDLVLLSGLNRTQT